MISLAIFFHFTNKLLFFFTRLIWQTHLFFLWVPKFIDFRNFILEKIQLNIPVTRLIALNLSSYLELMKQVRFELYLLFQWKAFFILLIKKCHRWIWVWKVKWFCRTKLFRSFFDNVTPLLWTTWAYCFSVEFWP